MAAVLFVSIFLLVSREFRIQISRETRLSSHRVAWAAGALFIVVPSLFEAYAGGSVALSVAFLLLVWLGAALLTIPQTSAVITRYFALAVLAVVGPNALGAYFGNYLVGAASFITTGTVSFLGIPVLWKGATFQLVSLNGSLISAVVTADCVNFATISLLLMLLILMKFELGKDNRSTLKAAVPSVLAVFLVSSLRLILMIVTGYIWGAGAFWSVHEWIAYPMFLGAYAAVMLAYGSGAGRSPFQGGLPCSRGHPGRGLGG